MSWNADMIGKVLYTQLGSLCGGRIYPVIASQGTAYPFIVYNAISTTPDHTKDSTSVADKVRVQIDIYSETYEGTNTIAGQVRTQLDLLKGTISGAAVDTIRFEDDADFYENEVRLYRKQQDYIIRTIN